MVNTETQQRETGRMRYLGFCKNEIREQIKEKNAVKFGPLHTSGDRVAKRKA
jgi:hypothetical protein